MILLGLIESGLTATLRETQEVIKKLLRSGRISLDSAPQTTTLIKPNEQTEDIMKIVKYLKDSGLLIKSVTQTIKNEAKKQRVGFLGMLLGTLSVSLLGNLFAGKDVTRTN